MPLVAVAGFGDFSTEPRVGVVNSTTYNPSVSMIKILNRHTVKFGYEHRRYYDNFINARRRKLLSFNKTRSIGIQLTTDGLIRPSRT
ncbi:MAG: hypothetical protein WKF84_10020 [Pyrinomonadaceae bacterium]